MVKSSEYLRKMNFKNYRNKKVLIIGHSGFKGSWLANWLIELKAKVYGISKKSINRSKTYVSTKLNKRIFKEYDFDIRDLKKLNKTINQIKPDYIFFLAAQSLVGKSYKDPVTTWEINFVGALNILDVVKNINFKTNLVLITSDKCYENIGKKSGYKETDTLGGSDPYSASKASVEILYNSYFRSFLKNRGNIKSVTTRAGNVIGGGDMSDDRLIPDCIRAWSKKKILKVRNPDSTRPWQHVLEPLNGYLKLGLYLNYGKYNGKSFNFGPSIKNSKPVKDIMKECSKYLHNFKYTMSNSNFFHEHRLLQLNCDEAKKKLNWKPKLNFKKTISFTIDWYVNFYKKKDMFKFTKKQINEFMKII